MAGSAKIFHTLDKFAFDLLVIFILPDQFSIYKSSVNLGSIGGVKNCRGEIFRFHIGKQRRVRVNNASVKIRADLQKNLSQNCSSLCVPKRLPW